MSKGIELIAAERKRQTEAEGWTPEHDAQHEQGELAIAAACYALNKMPNCEEVWREETSDGVKNT